MSDFQNHSFSQVLESCMPVHCGALSATAIIGRFSLLSLIAFLTAWPASCHASEPQWQYLRDGGQKAYVYYVSLVIGQPGNGVQYDGKFVYSVMSANSDQVRFDFSGELKASTEPPESITKLPKWTRLKGTSETTRLYTRFTLSRIGDRIESEAETQLPFLLGNVAELVFEALPSSASGNPSVPINSTWQKTVPTSFSSLPTWTSRDYVRSQQSATRAVVTPASQTDYRLVSLEQDSATIKAKSALREPVEADKARFELDGEKTWVFDLRDGMPRSSDIRLDLTITASGIEHKIPVTIQWRRQSQEEFLKDQAETDERNAKAAEWVAEIEERRRQAALPLNEAEVAEAVLVLHSKLEDRMHAVLTRLNSATVPDEPDPQLLEGIRKLLQGNPSGRAYALLESVANQWLPGYRQWVRINRAYEPKSGMAWPVSSSKFPVTDKTPLQIGQIVQYSKEWQWFPVEIVSLNSDSTAHVRLIGARRNMPSGPFLVLRQDLQLAHEELDQPGKPGVGSPFPESTRVNTTPDENDIQKVATSSDSLSSSPKSSSEAADPSYENRIWRDSTGRHEITAAYLGSLNDSVQLKRTDGKVITVPLSKLSPQDNKYVQEINASNPFN